MHWVVHMPSLGFHRISLCSQNTGSLWSGTSAPSPMKGWVSSRDTWTMGWWDWVGTQTHWGTQNYLECVRVKWDNFIDLALIIPLMSILETETTHTNAHTCMHTPRVYMSMHTQINACVHTRIPIHEHACTDSGTPYAQTHAAYCSKAQEHACSDLVLGSEVSRVSPSCCPSPHGLALALNNPSWTWYQHDLIYDIWH